MSGTNKMNFIIFGGTGDLSYRKLLPALFNLYKRGRLGQSDCIYAIGRREYSDKEYKDIIKDWIIKFTRFEADNEAINETIDDFFNYINYIQMDFTQIDEYKKLIPFLTKSSLEKNIFYLAVAPKFFENISEGLMTISSTKNMRIVLEKPFGETLARAQELSNTLEKCFGEKNIYRIDHYLGKEVVRSILTMRATNPVFLRTWNKENIQDICIQALEEVGIGSRGAYYDEAGAMKDMLQNHLMQILSIVAMELPDSISDIAAIQRNQEEVLSSLRLLEKVDLACDLTLAQYEGYLAEAQVSPNSQTESYVSCRLFIDNERWQDVPFILTTGKKLATRSMSIIVNFKPIGHSPANRLIFEVQPREGVRFSFNIKEPGESNAILPVEMEFCQSCNLDYNSNTPEAYERLIDAVMQADRTWFSTWKQIASSWSYIEALKHEHKKLKLPLLSYEVGSEGPTGELL